MASAVGGPAGPSCNEGDGAETDAKTGAGIVAGTSGDTDGSEGVESKIVDITMSDKINKTLILVSY